MPWPVSARGTSAHAVLGINTMLMKHRVHSPYPMLWSTDVEPVVANVRWLDGLADAAEGPPTALRLRLAFAEGSISPGSTCRCSLCSGAWRTARKTFTVGEDAFVPSRPAKDPDRLYEED